MKVKPSLYLNMSPQTTEEGALAFARNMKLDDDGNLVSDYGYKDITCTVSNDANPAVALNTYNIVGHIVGLDNKIYFFCAKKSGKYWIDEGIVEYNEISETAEKLNTEWTYNGGEIDGYVSTNQSGEKILTIAEYKDGNNVPLKHINLSFPDARDESIYCQAPACPTANLVLTDTYVKTIPNGVYVFFIRYKIRKDVYTNWFLCSRPIFGGTSEKITTLQGGLSYINFHKDSAKSFVFHLDFAQINNIDSYSEFQLGFIISHDEATDARTWKHFNMTPFNPNGGTIYFDYENVEEANIDDLLETTYELYNVRNVTAFKNKLYISNYIESNFNPDIVNTLKDYITLSVAHTKSQGSSDIDYKNMTYNATPLHYDYSKGYYDRATGGADIKSLINSNHFNYDITKLAKLESKEKSNVARFDVFWNADINPDIALVYNIYNDLHNKVIFGQDWLTPIPDTYGPAGWPPEESYVQKIANVGLRLNAMGANAYIYAPLKKNSTESGANNNHPWYNLGFTFGFGSFKADEVGTPNYKLGCSLFNAFNYWYDYDYIAGRTATFDSNTGWFTRDSGFADFARSTIENTIQREIEDRSFFAKAYLEIASGANTYLIDYDEEMDLDNYAGHIMNFNFMTNGGPAYDYQDKPWKYYSDVDGSDKTHLEILNPELFSTTTMSASLNSKIKTWVYNVIYNKIVGVDENGAPVLNVGTANNPIIIRANSISVNFKKIDFTVENEDINTSEGHYVKRFKISMKTTDYTSLCTFAIKNNYIHVTDRGIGAEQLSTLMPLSTYQPYVHFVDKHNIITNGVKLPSFPTDAAYSNDDVLYLKYTVADNIPANNFESFFISLVSIGDIVMEGFGYSKVPNSTTNIVHCLEIDTLLYNINDNITVKLYNSQGQLHRTFTDARYYSSGSSYPPLAFGNCGFIVFEDGSDWSAYKIYIIISRNKSAENIDNLPKASSYIPFKTETTPKKLPDGYYGSWRCLVKKPSFELSSSCYVSGKDVYAVNRTTALALNEFKSFIQVQDSITYFVRSNFNLNYLSLTEDIADNIFTVGSASSGVKQVARVINSAILSSIYELKPMYKDFANKFFRSFDSDYKIDFDNTVRVSNVLSDETFNNSVFKFASADYYNVPTDRGIIVNLFSIGNNVFVHCKGSLYKFDGNATIAANDKDIQLQSTEPFNAGITQILDSEYGYGGIDTKQAGCITFDSYFFYDQASNHIFAYGGNSQIQLIDGNIYKLLSYYKPSECKTLHDELNCRVLFEFTSGRDEHNRTGVSYNTFTISYNYKTKTFVSFHDISLVNAFASRHKAYSYKYALVNLFNTDSQIDTNKLVEEMNVNRIFGGATTACIIEFGSQIYKKQASPFGIAVVLFPQANLRETIDSVRYVSDIQQLDSETQSIPVYDVLVNPQVTRNNPVTNFYIITDSCISSLVTTNVDDTARPDIGHEDQKDDKYYRKNNTSTTPMTPSTLMDYKGFKYDMGFWTSNYFRNKLNEADIYGYSDTVSRALGMDRNSLVYGRYFILVFDFKPDTPIKFEDVYMNTDKY